MIANAMQEGFVLPVMAQAPHALQRIEGFQWSQSTDLGSNLDALVRLLRTAEIGWSESVSAGD